MDTERVEAAAQAWTVALDATNDGFAISTHERTALIAALAAGDTTLTNDAAVERVARVIAHAEGWAYAVWDGRDMNATVKRDYRRQARAAITVLLEGADDGTGI